MPPAPEPDIEPMPTNANTQPKIADDAAAKSAMPEPKGIQPTKTQGTPLGFHAPKSTSHIERMSAAQAGAASLGMQSENFGYSRVRLRRIKKLQFGVVDPNELVSYLPITQK